VTDLIFYDPSRLAAGLSSWEKLRREQWSRGSCCGIMLLLWGEFLMESASRDVVLWNVSKDWSYEIRPGNIENIPGVIAVEFNQIFPAAADQLSFEVSIHIVEEFMYYFNPLWLKAESHLPLSVRNIYKSNDSNYNHPSNSSASDNRIHRSTTKTTTRRKIVFRAHLRPWFLIYLPHRPEFMSNLLSAHKFNDNVVLRDMMKQRW
jgi:hypothetical protein